MPSCKLCQQSFTAHRYLYTHLSENHFANQLDTDLPKSGPWKCPKCSYLGSDQKALRVHYGVRHKIVLNHLAAALGVSQTTLKKEMSAGRKKGYFDGQKVSFGCKLCDATFRDLKEVETHVTSHFKPHLGPII